TGSALPKSWHRSERRSGGSSPILYWLRWCISQKQSCDQCTPSAAGRLSEVRRQRPQPRGLAHRRYMPKRIGRPCAFVPHAEMRILDPVWTTGMLTRNHGYLVYDTLFGTDENLQIKPQMVDRTTVSPDGMKYTFTLRDGLQW